MEQNIYKIKEIAEDIYQIEEYGVYCYLVVGTKKALLIDTCTGFGDLSALVRTLTDKPVIVAATHAHPDHIGGRGSFPYLFLPKKERGLARFYGTLWARRAMFGKKSQQLYGKTRKDILKGKFRTKYIPFEEGKSFDLGNKNITCMETPGHTKASTVFILREDKIIFTGDGLCRALWMFLPGATTVKKWIEGAEKTFRFLPEYTAYSAHDADAQDPALIEKLIETAKDLVQTRKNSFFPKVRVFPEQYTDHGIVYRTTRIK